MAQVYRVQLHLPDEELLEGGGVFSFIRDVQKVTEAFPRLEQTACQALADFSLDLGALPGQICRLPGREEQYYGEIRRR